MKILFALTCLAACCSASAQTTPSAQCMTLNEVSNAQTPVDLTRSMLQCINSERWVDAADLFNVGGVYAKFDTLRVSDRSAHAAYGALKAQAAGMLSEQQVATFQTTLEERSSNPEYPTMLCAAVKKAGVPSYRPDYMTNHGMGAFTGNTGINPDFNAATAWNEVLTTYLPCK